MMVGKQNSLRVSVVGLVVLCVLSMATWLSAGGQRQSPNSKNDPGPQVGERLAFFCENHVYAGTVEISTARWVCLTNTMLVHEIGPLDATDWADAEYFPYDPWCISRSSIESFGVLGPNSESPPNEQPANEF